MTTIPDRTTLAGIRVSFHVCPSCIDGRVGKLSCRRCAGRGFTVAKSRGPYRARVPQNYLR